MGSPVADIHNFFRMWRAPASRAWIAYGGAIVLPTAALLLHATFADQELLIFFVAPIALCAAIGGLWPGLLATAFSAALVHAHLGPSWQPIFQMPEAVLLFIVGAASSFMIDAVRRQDERLERALAAARVPAEEARASEERFSVVFHHAPVAIMIERLSDGQLVDVNSAFTELTGYTRQEAMGRPARELGLWGDPVQLMQKLKDRRNADTLELQVRRKDGQRREVVASVSLVQFLGSAHLLVMAADVTEKHLAVEMERIAYHDTLTNLPNRLLLKNKLREAATRTRETGRASAVLFIDLDQFKPVNDTYGHEAGDELLRLAAARLRGRLRSSDTLARVGGDEFVVLLEGLLEERQAEHIAGDLVHQMAATFVLSGGRRVQIGASIGVTYIDPYIEDVDELIRRSDAALYAAKHAGRNTVRVFKSHRPSLA